jgi:hypothetical protein
MSGETRNGRKWVSKMSSNVVDGNFSSLDLGQDSLTGLDRWLSREDVVEGIREDVQTKFGADKLHNFDNGQRMSLLVCLVTFLSEPGKFGFIEERKSAPDGRRLQSIMKFFHLFPDRALVDIEEGADRGIWNWVLSPIPQYATCMSILL